jgi:hypothetical protein
LGDIDEDRKYIAWDNSGYMLRNDH